jgi:hypothetical protein
MMMYRCSDCGCVWECEQHSLGGTMCPDCSSFEVGYAPPNAIPTTTESTAETTPAPVCLWCESCGADTPHTEEGGCFYCNRPW